MFGCMHNFLYARLFLHHQQTDLHYFSAVDYRIIDIPEWFIYPEKLKEQCEWTVPTVWIIHV